MRAEDIVFGLFLISCVGIIAGVERLNNWLQDRLAKRHARRYNIGVDISENQATAVVLRRERDGSFTYVGGETYELNNGTDYEAAQERFRRAQREAAEWEPGR